MLLFSISQTRAESDERSYPSESSTKSDSSTFRPNFAINICDVLADKDGIPKGVLNCDNYPGLAYQVVLLQDRLQLAQHIISGLRAELKEEKSVKYFQISTKYFYLMLAVTETSNFSRALQQFHRLTRT